MWQVEAQPQPAQAQATDKLQVWDQQVIDEVLEAGLQLADEAPWAKPKATAGPKPGEAQATTKQELEDPQVTVEPKPKGAKASQGVGRGVLDPGAGVLSLPGRPKDGDPARICHNEAAVGVTHQRGVEVQSR